MAIRAPVAGLSMASTTSPSSSRIGFCRFPTNNRTSSFLGSGVGALKVRGLRLARPSTTRCNSIRSNLFDRFARVVKSYANALISTFEDPEKILEQAVTEMNDDLVKMRQATAQVLASQKRLENKYKTAEQASEDCFGPMAPTLLPPATVNHRNPPLLTATNPFLPSIYSVFTFSCSTNRITPSHLRSSRLWTGRCRAASPHPPPPESEPPPGDDQSSSSGSIASLSRIQESVQIFCAVFFWMSLFFWSSVWDGRNKGRSDKGPRFWK